MDQFRHNVYRFGQDDIANLAGKALAAGGRDVDIYCLPAAYAPKFIKGEYSSFASAYKELGIDVDAALKKADIPECIIEDGSNPNGELIALPYLAETAVFAYRRSAAKEVWGTDDPDRIADIIGAGTQKWDRFIEGHGVQKCCHMGGGLANILKLFHIYIENIP